MAHDLASALLPGSGCDPVSYHDAVKMASVQPSHFHISTGILTYLYGSRLSSLALCPAAIHPAFRFHIYTHFLSPCNKSPQTPWFTMAHTYWKSTVSAEFSPGKFHKEGSRCSQGYVHFWRFVGDCTPTPMLPGHSQSAFLCSCESRSCIS